VQRNDVASDAFAAFYRLFVTNRSEMGMNMGKKVATIGMLIALAMIFSYIEVLIPINFGIPGVKLGLANLVVVISLYCLPLPWTWFISLIRIFLMGILFGNGASLLYSMAGGILSLFVMSIFKQIKGFSIMGVSVGGGVSHNVGQILMAVILLGNASISYYLPVLLVSGVITGICIGQLSVHILKLIKKADVLYH